MNGDKGFRAGHCLCGAIAYRVPHPFTGAIAHCHCSMCRRQAASVSLPWFKVPRDRFALTTGTLRIHRSSEHGERGFCGDCGTPITFWTRHHPDLIDVTLCSLEEEQIVKPDMHIYSESRLPWLTLDPDLPDRTDD
jgi:hypothetical protein